MAYRRTAGVIRRMAERHDTIVMAAEAVAGEGGMAAVQIAAVADRAGIAAGTVYRYFPGKTDLVGALVARVCEAEHAAMHGAAQAAPGPLSALAAGFAAFGTRALSRRRLIWAVLGEPVEPEIEAPRLDYRRAFAAEIEDRIAAAIAGGHLPEQDPALAAAALFGGLLEGLVGPLSRSADADPARAREMVQELTLLALRGLGMVDARARGLIAASPPQANH